MITDDIIIDRRIILEAETLIENGHEVIILAGWQAEVPENEWVGKIKIERVNPQILIRPFDRFLIRYRSAVINLLNNFSTKIQTFFYKKIFKRQESLRKIISSKITPRSITDFFFACILKAFLLLIELTAKVNNLFVRVLRMITSKKRSDREECLLRKAIYFNPDIIHIHDLPQLKSGVSIKQALNIPLIYDAHEFYPEQPRLSKAIQLYLRKLEKKYIGKADLVITVNPMLAKKMEETYLNVKVNVVQNAVNPPENFDITTRYNRFREEYNINKDKIILLFQGFIAIGRNLEIIIGGMKYLKNTPYVLLIMGYGDYVNDLIKMVKDEQLESQVMFIPAKSQNELLFYSASADIGIIPYPYGQDVNTTLVSPNKLYEFMIAGLPILSNDLPFVKAVIEENQVGMYMDIQDERRFADAVRNFSLEKIPQFRAKVQENRYKFTWENESKVMLSLYTPFLT